MAVETPTWTYKSEGDKQTASEMNQLAQAVMCYFINSAFALVKNISLSDNPLYPPFILLVIDLKSSLSANSLRFLLSQNQQLTNVAKCGCSSKLGFLIISGAPFSHF